MFFTYQSPPFSYPLACESTVLVDRDYIFTLYSMGAGAVYRYLQQIERRVEDAEERAARSHDAVVARLTKELASTKRTLLRKSQQLLEERQLNHQLRRRIRELEHEIERGTTTVELDSHNSSLPPSLDPPWKKVKRTRSLRQKTGMKAGGPDSVTRAARSGRLLSRTESLPIRRPPAGAAASLSGEHGPRAAGAVRSSTLRTVACA